MGSLVSPVAPVPLAELGRVHFTGIGGAGMSGIARIMLARGVKVSGSDAAADFALCRSGALTCAEMTTVGLPAAYVPLPHGNGEQRLNALPIEQAGGGLIVDDAALSPEWICEVLLPVMLDTPLVAGMSEAAARLGSRDTDDRLAYEVMNIIAGRPPRSRAAHGR